MRRVLGLERDALVLPGERPVFGEIVEITLLEGVEVEVRGRVVLEDLEQLHAAVDITETVEIQTAVVDERADQVVGCREDSDCTGEPGIAEQADGIGERRRRQRPIGGGCGERGTVENRVEQSSRGGNLYQLAVERGIGGHIESLEADRAGDLVRRNDVGTAEVRAEGIDGGLDVGKRRLRIDRGLHTAEHSPGSVDLGGRRRRGGIDRRPERGDGGRDASGRRHRLRGGGGRIGPAGDHVGEIG